MAKTKYEPGIYVIQGEDATVLALHAGPWWFPFLHEADAGEKEPWGEVLAGPISIDQILSANQICENVRKMVNELEKNPESRERTLEIIFEELRRGATMLERKAARQKAEADKYRAIAEQIWKDEKD